MPALLPVLALLFLLPVSAHAGYVIGWGKYEWGESALPPSNDFVAVDAEAAHSLALHADGSLASWGFDNHGETDVPPGTDFVAISAGSGYSLAQRSDGSIVAWGSDDQDRTNVPARDDFVFFVAGPAHGLAIIPEPGTLALLTAAAFLALVATGRKKGARATMRVVRNR